MEVGSDPEDIFYYCGFSLPFKGPSMILNDNDHMFLACAHGRVTHLSCTLFRIAVRLTGGGRFLELASVAVKPAFMINCQLWMLPLVPERYEANIQL